MSRFIETIKCKEGRLYNLAFHNARLNTSRKENYRQNQDIDLGQAIHIPGKYRKGMFRCRVSYGKNIDKVEFIPHHYRKVESLKIIECSDIDYHYKYTDRRFLDDLYASRGDQDDIVIVKNGFITDSYTANIVLYDGRKWWTPDTPLLPGTQRARQLKDGKIFECRITPADLKNYIKAGLINAMWDMENMPVIDIEKIRM